MEKTPEAANTPTVLQTEMTECGAACLAMILRYHGQYATLEEMRMETDVSRDGCSAGNLIRAAEKRGLLCQGLQVDIDQLHDIKPPSVLWWAEDHFLVFEGIAGEKYLLNDPAFGKRSLSREEMEKEFSGVVLTFEPADHFKDHTSFGKKPITFLSSGKLAGAVTGYGSIAWITLILGLASVGLAITAAKILESAGFGPIKTLLAAILTLLLFVPGACLWMYLTSRWEDRAEVRGSWPYLRRLLMAPMAFLEDRYPEDLVGRVDGNDRINRAAVVSVVYMVTGGAGVLGALCIMSYTSPAATVPVILGAIFSALFCVFFRRYMDRDHVKATVLESNLIRTAFTDIDKRDVIKASGRGEEYRKRLVLAHDLAQNMRRSIREREELHKIIKVAITCIAASASFFIRYIQGADIFKMLSWAILMFLMISGCELLLNFFENLRSLDQDLQAGLLRTGQDTAEIKRPGANERDYRKLRGNINCRGVGFGYGSLGKMLFDDLDLDIPGGSVLIITGTSGCGKSTLGKILAGLMPPTHGEIRYDGKLMTQISRKTIYASIATVKQKSVLFPGTIRENITMWNPNITEDEILEAVRDACAEDFINSRKDGLQIRLGPGGRGLSGGEQQRIEIARALATDPSILILDEAFSAIDDETTLRIMDNIRRRGCTCILITADEVLLQSENRVLVLNEG